MKYAPNRMFVAWLVVALLWFVAALNYLDRIMITTMRGTLVEAIPMSDAQFGLLTSAFLWVYAFLSPLAGFTADRTSRTRIIVGSVLAWSLITWLTSQATSFEMLLVSRALMGVSEAFYFPAALALIVDYQRGATRSLATGIHLSGASVGSALGGLGGWLAEERGWNFAFELFGMIGIVYAILLAFLLREAPREAPADEAVHVPAPRFSVALAHLFAKKSFIMIFLFWGLLGVASWAIIGWMPTYMNQHFGLSQGAAGMYTTGCFQGAALVGMIFGGAWADRWTRTNPRGRILVPVIGLVIAAPAVLLVATTTMLPIALAGLILFGMTRPFSDANMMPILCLICDRRYRGTAYGMLNMCAGVIGGVTIYAGGALRDVGVNLSYVFLFGAGSLVVCAALLSFVRPATVAP